MNVHELDADGHSVKQWCFAPEGGIAAGDMLLAQKIALETMETRAHDSEQPDVSYVGGNPRR
jgi:hypothetical protein